MSDRAEQTCARSCNWHGSGTRNIKACQKNARQELSSDMRKSPRASPDKNPIVAADYCGHRSKKHRVLSANPKPVLRHRPLSVESLGRFECSIFTAANQLKLHSIHQVTPKVFQTRRPRTIATEFCDWKIHDTSVNQTLYSRFRARMKPFGSKEVYIFSI